MHLAWGEEGEELPSYQQLLLLHQEAAEAEEVPLSCFQGVMAVQVAELLFYFHQGVMAVQVAVLLFYFHQGVMAVQVAELPSCSMSLPWEGAVVQQEVVLYLPLELQHGFQTLLQRFQPQ
jgi:hypothetical protein